MLHSERAPQARVEWVTALLLLLVASCYHKTSMSMYKHTKVSTATKAIAVGLAISLYACTSASNTTEQGSNDEIARREIELKEKELKLKERELKILESEKRRESNERDLSDLYRDLKRSIFTIYTLDDESNLSQGSAFIIDPSGIALSNYHVFENAADAIAVNEIGEKFQINEILEYDKDLDYLVFRLGPNVGRFTSLPVATELPEVGQDCFAIGNPEQLTNTLTKGIISAFRDDETIIQTDTEFTHGSSGGPLFNSRGEVIGITTAVIEGENLNFAINIRKIPLQRILSSSNRGIGTVAKTFDATAFVKNYFAVLEREDYQELHSIFAEKMKRYYDAYNPDKSWVISDIQSYKKRFKVNSVSYTIDEPSIQQYIAANGNNTVEFEMDYVLDRQEKEKPSVFHLMLFMEIDQEGKVVSIYEDILEKY